MIGAGAKVLGPFTVGNNCRVASNAVVLSAVPSNSTAVGIPARIVQTKGKKNYVDEVDQISVEDPMQEELESLQACMEKVRVLLTEKGEELKEETKSRQLQMRLDEIIKELEKYRKGVKG
ncbi:hypothetical protein SDC9_127474 [bioreactor metagenome]|uniref:Serine O-acetyltransferase n=1 Tax=bioreactor metagenome TaxID=1076179 RepID=A0A645CU29_9ZZZZ